MPSKPKRAAPAAEPACSNWGEHRVRAYIECDTYGLGGLAALEIPGRARLASVELNGGGGSKDGQRSDGESKSAREHHVAGGGLLVSEGRLGCST